MPDIRLTLGILALGLILFDTLYPSRRRLMAWPFGTAQRWLWLHVNAGILATVLVLFHGSFRRPAGLLGWLLLSLTLFATISGTITLLFERQLPRRLMASQITNGPGVNQEPMQRTLNRATAIHLSSAAALLAVVVVHLVAVWYF